MFKYLLFLGIGLRPSVPSSGQIFFFDLPKNPSETWQQTLNSLSKYFERLRTEFAKYSIALP
jgi:hypothetical protein